MLGSNEQPIEQLVEGGRNPAEPTLIHATADSEELSIRMLEPDGTALEDVLLNR